MGDDAGTPAMPMPPGGPIEIVFSFDTTGSMSSYIGQVRKQVNQIIERLLGDVPFLRIAVFAHGDYCDKRTYITKHVDFSRDVKDLCNFVEKSGSTGGGDWEECYELVLQEVRTNLSWQPGSQRALVMIGDAIPHEPAYYKTNLKKKQAINWKEETRRLHEEVGVRIYAVQCGQNARADFFYEHLAKETDGQRLQLDNFDHVVDLIMAICYRETGPDIYAAFEKEVRAREGKGIRQDLDRMFGDLRTAPPVLRTADSTSSTRSMRKRARSPSPEEEPVASTSTDIEEPVKKKRKTSDKTVASPKTVRSAKKVVKKTALKKTASRESEVILSQDFLRTLKTRPTPREKVKNEDFTFAELPWSRWQLAMVNDGDVPTRGHHHWHQRTNGHVGMRNTALFHDGRKEAAAYEVAVQPKGAGWKYPVVIKTTIGFLSRHWDTYVLRDWCLRKEIDTLIKAGSKIYIRRAFLDLPCTLTLHGQKVKAEGANELGRLMRRVYDYSWSRRKLVRKARGYRHITKLSVKK